MAALGAYCNTITLDGFALPLRCSVDVEEPRSLTNACHDDGSRTAERWGTPQSFKKTALLFIFWGFNYRSQLIRQQDLLFLFSRR